MPATNLKDAVTSFSEALEAVHETVSTVYNRGYKIQNSPYRSIYLKRTRKLQKEFFALQRVSRSKSHFEVKKIEEYLRPILDLSSLIERKKRIWTYAGISSKLLKRLANPNRKFS